MNEQNQSAADERAKFEKKLDMMGYVPSAITRDAQGFYNKEVLNFYWSIWQAASTPRAPSLNAEQIAAWKELASKGVQASCIIGNLPEFPGYNGSLLTIDDTEAERIEADIDLIVNAIRSLIEATPQPFPAPAVKSGELPELPEESYLGGDEAFGDVVKGYTSIQMQAYARQAIAQTAPAVAGEAITDEQLMQKWSEMYPSDNNSWHNAIPFARAVLSQGAKHNG